MDEGGMELDLDLAWEEYLGAILRPVLLSSRMQARHEAIHGATLKMKQGGIPSELIPELLDVMMETIPRFHDDSRKSVLTLLVEMYRKFRVESGDGLDNPFMVKVSGIIASKLKTASLAGMSAASLFSLLKWTSKLLEMTFLRLPKPSPAPYSQSTSQSFRSLLMSHSELLVTIANTTTVPSASSRTGAILRQSLKITRRFLLMGGDRAVETTLGLLLTPSAVEGKEGMRPALVIGCAVNVAVHKNWQGVIEKFSDSIVKFYVKTVLVATSKTVLPTAVLDGFFTFFQIFVPLDKIERDILTGAERQMLRSPEVVIRIYEGIFRSMDFDTSTILKEKFADPLLTHMKSSNEGKNDDVLSQVVDIVIKAFSVTISEGKAPAPECRPLYYTCLIELPGSPPVSKKVITGVLPLIPKETTDQALLACFNALSKHLHAYLTTSPDTAVLTSTFKTLLAGLADSKTTIRRATLWCIESALVGDALKAVPPASLTSLVESCVKIIDKVQGSSNALLDSKKDSPTLIEGYLAVRWIIEVTEWELEAKKDTISALLEKKKFFATLLSLGQRSWFLNEKYYSKLLISPEEQKVMAKCLLKVLSRDRLYNMIGPVDSLKERLPLANAATFLLVEFEAASRILLAIQSLLPANTENVSSSALHNALLDLAVLASHPVVTAAMGSDSWVRLCFRSGCDPNEVVCTLGPSRVLAWLKDAEVNEVESWKGVVLEGLGGAVVKDIRPVDVEIWAGEEGVLVVDVTGKRKEKANGQDNVRLSQKQAVAEKKGSNAKAIAAAKAEKEAERVQLEKESKIRKQVGNLRENMLSILSTLDAVIRGVSLSLDDDARDALSTWTSRLISALCNVMTRELVVFKNGRDVAKGAVLAGKRTMEVYKSLASVSDSRMTKYIGQGWDTAMYRLMGLLEGPEGLDPEACKKDLGASDIILAHSGMGGSASAPRRLMVESLLQLIVDYPRLHGAAREGLLTLCVSMEDAAADIDPDVEFDDEDEQFEFEEARKQDAEDEKAIINELLSALVSHEPAAREASLRALQHLPVPEGALNGVGGSRVWTLRHDTSESIAAEAVRIWEMWNDDNTVGKEILSGLLELVVSNVAEIRGASGRALCAALKELPDEITTTFTKLYDLYAEKNVLPMPEYDEYGMVIPESLEKEDDWKSRSGVALALKACSENIEDSGSLRKLFEFLIEEEALGDRDERVRGLLLEAGIAAVGFSGREHVSDLLKVFSACLSRPAGTSKTSDWVRESVVILLGTAAQHLDPSDSRIPEVVERLVETLKTPSEAVQIAVSECLPALVKVMPEIRGLIQRLLKLLFDSPKYGDRRGAAYGLAGVVRGRGITALKEFGIMSSLKEAVEDKKRPERREGALFAFEAMSSSLGRLFEPYVIQILPLLLVCYGDTQKEVREATNDACKVIMSKLSGHCVKLVMPAILKALEDKSWRTKTGAIEVLGSMAFLAPKQLSLSLPTIVPRLCEVLADTHMKVHETAKQALRVFGNVIKNPEIQELVPVILAALVDPNAKTQSALSALLDTSFVHYIDAPSLALIVPILQRGLTERVTETKKKAAQIMGQMASLTDQKDLIPYLKTLLPGLKEVLVDPVPEARAIAARALGSMVEKLGEDNFPGLVSELLLTLKSETSAVDRFGAAQGLSDVLAGIGISRMEGLLPEIINNAMSVRPYVREGFMTLLVYLPTTFGEGFTPHLGAIITPILRGLADETDTVRETSLKAGKVIVRNYATSAVDLLLPELELGLFDENWRIRQSSIQLMGDLLYRIAGISGRADTDGTSEEETLGTEHGKQALVSALGLDRYNGVLSSLYIVRSDQNAIVRQASLHVWKSIVNNTPRTLKEILSVLMKMVISSLASSSYEKRGVAARTLGDLVRKLGDAVLEEIIPILEQGLESPDTGTREGVCIGMTEIMATAGKAQVADFVLDCLPSVRRALLDSEVEVREAAAQAFDMLHQHLGSRAIDEVLPSLLNELTTAGDTSSGSNYALEALKEIMSVRSNVVFPVLIPTLLTTPITSFNARALGSLVTVAGPALNRRLPTILTTLMDALDQKDSAEPDIYEALKVILMSIDTEGLHILMSVLEESVSEGSVSRRRAACECLMTFCAGSKVDYSEYVTDWMNRLVGLLRGPPMNDVETVKAAWGALDAMTRSIKKDDLERFVMPLRRAIGRATEGLREGQDLDGFCLPKGLSPVLPIFLQGLMYGGPDTRQESAAGLGDLVNRTSADALKPFVTQITGPLIRIIGDRFPASVKSAILKTLCLLLNKVPGLLKPFLPQLQRTFIKSLSEPSAEIREPARQCLTVLITLQTRLDPVIVELTTGIRAAEDNGVKKAMLEALLGLLRNLGNGRDINETSRKAVEALLMEGVLGSGENDDVIRVAAANSFGALCSYISRDESKAMLGHSNLDPSPGLLADLGQESSTIALIQRAIKNDKPPVTEAGVRAAGAFLSTPTATAGDSSSLLVALIGVATPETTQIDSRRIAIKVIKAAAKANHQLVRPLMTSLVPTLMLCVRDRVIPIKLAAERALIHVFRLTKPDGAEVLKRYLEGLDASASRSIGDYAKRVLSTLAAKESDDEEEEI
ncbi:translational activator of GCN4 [Irineochytrium annulatum]|nr:translational activator of GCN4 [Irineochytrium annulatum]